MLRKVQIPRPAPVILSLLLAAARLTGTEPATAVWRLDQLVQIGGHPVEVLGAPRVVTGPGGPAMHFNGTSDGMFLPVNPLQGLEQFTIEACFMPAADGPEAQRFLHVQDNVGAPGDPGSRALLEIRLANGTWAFDAFLFSKGSKAGLALFDATKRHPADRWTWVAMVYDRGRMASYIDGVKELEGEIAFPPMGAGRISLGVRQNKVFWFKGGIREVRFHPTALAAGQLQRIESR